MTTSRTFTSGNGIAISSATSPLVVDREIFERFPEVMIGTLVAEGVDNSGTQESGESLSAGLLSTGLLSSGLRAAEKLAAESLAVCPVVEHPRIAPWRDAYRSFGAKPKKYPSSIEALARRVLKGNPLPSINPLVDIYNAVSLRHLLPVGAEDLECVSGTVRLRFAGESEPSVEMLGRPGLEAPLPGEVIYADDEGAICRRWNWREARRTALSAETTRAILVVEALPPTSREELDAALESLSEDVIAHCGGSIRKTVHSS